MIRTSLALRVVLPAVWIGLIVGISFIEAPLKFQAPGITVPLGLGIGRLVFTAMNAVALALLTTLTFACVRPRVSRGSLVMLVLLWVVLLAQVLLVRPALNARTDLMLGGMDPGESSLHYLYIACDGVIFVSLIVFVVLAVRPLLVQARVGVTPPRASFGDVECDEGCRADRPDDLDRDVGTEPVVKR